MMGEVYLLDVDSSDMREDNCTLADDNIQAQSTIRGILP